MQGTETMNMATRINLKDMVSSEDKHQKVNSMTVRSKEKPDGCRGAPGGGENGTGAGRSTGTGTLRWEWGHRFQTPRPWSNAEQSRARS